MSSEHILGKEVSVGSIDKELKLLWEQDDANTNASLINLVIYSETAGSIEANSDAARELTEEQACRAILVEIDRSIEEPSIRSFITAHCNIFNGKKSVCSEQVAFKMTGRASGRLRNTVFSHLASDLPLILWWQGEFTFVLTQSLLSVVDRLLIDSSDFSDPAASHAKLLELSEATQGHFVLQDIAWTRTYTFRLCFAQLFDQPVAQASLSTLQSIRVKCHRDHRISGLLFISWIATQAGWALEKKGESEFFFKDKNQEIPITLETADECAPLALVEVNSSTMHLQLKRDAGEKFIHQTFEAGSVKIDQAAPADEDHPSGLIASQLSRGGKNRLYTKTLPLFLELL